MDETLLLLHVVAAFCIFGTVVMHTAYALGAPATAAGLFVADRLWDVGGLGTLGIGIWMTIRFDHYAITDGWILIALGLFAIATVLGFPARRVLEPAPASAAAGTTSAATARSAIASPALLNGLRALVIVLLLADMIFKPGL